MQTYQTQNIYNHARDQHYLVEHDKKLKCICELCTCGKHHCPQKAIKTDFQTSYNRQFKKFQNLHQTQQRSTYRYQERHYSPEVMKTNYQQNFQKQYEMAPQPSLSNFRFEQVGKTVLAPPVPFMGVSSYQAQYQPYRMVQPKNENPETQILNQSPYSAFKRPAVRFQGISSYKSAFLAPPEPKKPESKPQYKKPEAPFYGSSTYKAQYKAYEIQPHQIETERFDYRNIPTVKFQGKSAYKDQFQPYKLQTLQTYDSRISNTKSDCKLDQIHVPTVNYINNKDHVYYDPELKKLL